MSPLVVLEKGKSPGSGCRDCPTMNDLIVAEKIAPWQKLKALVRHWSERPIDGNWNSLRRRDDRRSRLANRLDARLSICWIIIR
jgi:hypothetical protein